jgi:hypothetical protein
MDFFRNVLVMYRPPNAQHTPTVKEVTMANWIGAARSNHFEVKDADAFKRWAQAVDLQVFQNGDEWGVGAYDMWPDCRYDEEKDRLIEIDFVAELAAHLKEGEVAVLMEAGHEKLRYITGYATAVNSNGERVVVSLDDIYEKAKALGENVTLVQD